MDIHIQSIVDHEFKGITEDAGAICRHTNCVRRSAALAWRDLERDARAIILTDLFRLAQASQSGDSAEGHRFDALRAMLSTHDWNYDWFRGFVRIRDMEFHPEFPAELIPYVVLSYSLESNAFSRGGLVRNYKMAHGR